MKRFLAVTMAALTLIVVSAQKPLEIYVIDPEGGKAALWIAPSGETVLIDTGNAGERDNGRIREMFSAAGVSKIDYLISTHYHGDHVGGMQELVKQYAVGTYVDHGPTVEGPVAPNMREQVPGFQAAYAELWKKAKHLVVKPGDVLPVRGLDWRIVTSAGVPLKVPLRGAPGAGQPNPDCAQTPRRPEANNPDDNGQSVGSVVTLGRFRAADFGDLLWNKEIDLMCPNNPIGTVDLFMVTHHGLNVSNAPPLVHGLQPRVAIMQNGITKGANVEVMQTLRSSRGLEDVWQLHWSYTAGIEHNAPGVLIANLEEPAALAERLTGSPSTVRPPPHVPAYWIKVTANANGSFTVTNSRNNYSKTYAPRAN